VLVGESAATKFQALLERVPKEAELVSVSDRMFEQIAATQTPQGVAALVEIRQPDFDAILSRRSVILLIACGVQDPGNIGTIVRSGQALGASALKPCALPRAPCCGCPSSAIRKPNRSSRTCPARASA
jgi:tRNA G18 (ribose-2'-O)-methylase SpoU